MLVMEIASLGPLNKFLRRHPSVPINLVLYDVIVMSYEWYTFLCWKDLGIIANNKAVQGCCLATTSLKLKPEVKRWQ